jgi:acyl-CoA thioester hydrolase
MAIKPYFHKTQYYETDQMGIIHHSNYIRWFEEARVDLLEQLGVGYDKIEALGILSPVLGISCDYQQMTHFGETVQIEASILEYNGIRLRIGYTVLDEDGAVRATGASRHCFLTRQGQPLSLKRSFPEIDAILRGCLPDGHADAQH